MRMRCGTHSGAALQQLVMSQASGCDNFVIRIMQWLFITHKPGGSDTATAFEKEIGKQLKISNIMPAMDTLTVDELDDLINTATRMNSPIFPFIFKVVPFTGLSKKELLHLRPDWIYWRDGSMFDDDRPSEIHIPATDSCRHLVWDKPPNYTMKGGPCQYCRDNGQTDGFEVNGYSDQPTEEDTNKLSRVRAIPIREERAESELRRWFQILDRPGVPYSNDGLANAVQRVFELSSVDKAADYRTLQYTFIRVLAESGISKEEIKEIGPTGRIRYNTKSILRNSSTDYNFPLKTIDRLKALESIEPATAGELAEVLDTSTAQEIQVLKSSLEWNLVVTAGEKQLETQTATLYKTAPDTDLDAGIDCPAKNCERTFDALSGLGYHYNQTHD